MSRNFPHKSVARDRALDAIKQYRGWVKTSTVAGEAGMSLEAAKKQLQRLKQADLVDCDGKGRYRARRERRQRKLKPCCEKPIPKCRNSDKQRKTLSRTALIKRGWPKELIEQILPAGKDCIVKTVVVDSMMGRYVKARFYRVSRVKEVELQPWFEFERTKILRQSRSKRVEYSASERDSERSAKAISFPSCLRDNQL